MTRKKTTATRKPPRKATVAIQRGSVQIMVEDVELSQVPAVLRTVLGGLRRMSERWDELIPDLPPVTGSGPLEVVDDDDWGSRTGKRRVGF